MKWNQAFELNRPEIDRQHKTMVNLVNSLETTLRFSDARPIMGELLETLLQYAEEHFQYEEKGLVNCRIQGVQDHLAEHRRFGSQMQAFIHRFEDDDPQAGVELRRFLDHWLRHHILDSDRKHIQAF
ncbi:MAG: bacteriohemerythrin [bacterium]|nr:bacteriohemerythrin [bacterium]